MAEEKTNGSEEPRGGFTRRGFLRGAGISAVAAAVAETGLSQLARGQAAPDAGALNTVMSGEIKITLNINGQAREVSVEPRTTLLSALRDRLEPGLTGPKLIRAMPVPAGRAPPMWMGRMYTAARNWPLIWSVEK